MRTPAPHSQMMALWSLQEGFSFVHVVTANEDRHEVAKARGLDVHSRIKQTSHTVAGRQEANVPFFTTGTFAYSQDILAERPPTSQCQLCIHLLLRLKTKSQLSLPDMLGSYRVTA